MQHLATGSNCNLLRFGRRVLRRLARLRLRSRPGSRNPKKGCAMTTSVFLPTKSTAIVLTALAVSAALTGPSLADPLPTTGYTVTLFARGVAGVYVAPDSLTTDGSFVYAGYQNSAAADGSSGNSVVVNTYRAIGLIRLVGDSAVVTPVLQGDAMATDRTTGEEVRLNLTDPDSLSVDPVTGDVVLDDQADSQIIFVRNAATDAREVSRLLLQPASPAAPVVDEVTWTTSASGRFLVADHGNPGAIWVVHKTPGFTPAQAYVTVGNDSRTFTSSLGTLDTTSGLITPVVTNFSSPKGLIFVE